MTRQVTDILYKTDGAPWADAAVLFQRGTGSFDTTAGYPPDWTDAITDATGAYSVTLWPDASGSRVSRYVVTYPNGERFAVSVPAGVTPITMAELRASSASPPVPPTALDAHVAAPDPHAGYVLQSEADAWYAPIAHTQDWTTISGTPTTLGGYGITDAYTHAQTDTLLATKATKATTLAGYGITDAVTTTDPRLSDARVPLAHNQAWSTITSPPSTLGGYGITDAIPRTETQGGTPGAPATLVRWTVQPANTTNVQAAYKSRFYAQTYNTTVETVWSMGYNPDRAITTEPAAFMTIHSDAEDNPGIHHNEIQWQFVSPDGARSSIPVQTIMNRHNSLMEVSTTIRHGQGTTDTISLQDSAGTVVYLQAGPAQAGVRFLTAVNVKPNTGTGSLTVASASGAADLAIFPSGTNTATISLYRSAALAWQINTINGELRVVDSVNGTTPFLMRPGIAANMQLAFNGRMGFWGTAPIVKPAATPAIATDLPTALTLLNYIRTNILLAYGLAA